MGTEGWAGTSATVPRLAQDDSRVDWSTFGPAGAGKGGETRVREQVRMALQAGPHKHIPAAPLVRLPAMRLCI